MTRDEMIEKLAKHIAPMLDIWDSEKEIAAAVLDLCGPKPLVWFLNPDIGEGGYLSQERNGVVYHVMDDGWSIHRRGGWQDASSIQAAQAAAQAHADAAHWANTRMGDV